MERRELIRFLMATAGLKCLDGLPAGELLSAEGETRAFGVIRASTSTQGS